MKHHHRNPSDGAPRFSEDGDESMVRISYMVAGIGVEG